MTTLPPQPPEPMTQNDAAHCAIGLIADAIADKKNALGTTDKVWAIEKYENLVPDFLNLASKTLVSQQAVDPPTPQQVQALAGAASDKLKVAPETGWAIACKVLETLGKLAAVVLQNSTAVALLARGGRL